MFFLCSSFRDNFTPGTCGALSILRESFCESEEGVRLPRDAADLRGSPGNFRGSPGNFRGSPGNFREVWETSGEPPPQFHSERTFGEVAENFWEVRGTSGEVRGLSRSSGEPDSLPVTRQICPKFGVPGLDYTQHQRRCTAHRYLVAPASLADDVQPIEKDSVCSKGQLSDHFGAKPEVN